MRPLIVSTIRSQNLQRRWHSARLVLLSIAAGGLLGLLAVGVRLAFGAIAPHVFKLIGHSSPGVPGEGGLLMGFGTSTEVATWLLLPLAGMITAALWPRGTEPLGQSALIALGQEAQSLKNAFRGVAAGIVGHAGGLMVGKDAAFAALGGLGVRMISRLSRLSAGEERTLGLAGAAAAIGCVLHAPLAAAVLMAEVPYRRFEFEYEVLISCVLATVCAYTVYGMVFGFAPLFVLPTIEAIGLGNAPQVALVALGVTLAATLLVRVAELIPAATSVSERAVRGFAFGLISAAMVAFVGPQFLGDGGGWLNLTLAEQLQNEALMMSLGRALLLLLAAVLLGGVGLMPSLAAGGLLGGGLMFAAGGDVALGALLGSVCFLTVTHNVPVAAVLLAVAWAGDSVLPAALLGAGMAHWLSGEKSLLRQQADSRSRRVEVANQTAAILAEAAEATNTETNLYRRRVPSSWHGVAVARLRLPPGVAVVAVVRDGEMTLPRRSLRFLPEDEVMIVARPDSYAALDALLKLPELR